MDTTTTSITQTTTTAMILTTRTTKADLATIRTQPHPFPVSGIVGLTLGSLILCFIVGFIAVAILRVCLIRVFLLRTGLEQQVLSQHALARFDATDVNTMVTQYKLAIHNRQQSEIKENLIAHEEISSTK